MIGITVSFNKSKELKAAGFPQNSKLYYHTKTREVKFTEDIPKFRDWDKFYISAPAELELNKFIPNGTILKKSKGGMWIAEHKNIITRMHEYTLDAKAELIQKLFKEKLIRF